VELPHLGQEKAFEEISAPHSLQITHAIKKEGFIPLC
tara:strand:+ start:907 stop:1017 length:111 start_codon:yes stop_codon:yes gene_type:complete